MSDPEIPHDVPEADALDQRRDLVDEPEPQATGPDEESFEVPEADAIEQSQGVGGGIAYDESDDA